LSHDVVLNTKILYPRKFQKKENKEAIIALRVLEPKREMDKVFLNINSKTIKDRALIINPPTLIARKDISSTLLLLIPVFLLQKTQYLFHIKLFIFAIKKDRTFIMGKM
jgi:hypothetical protein